MKHLLLLATLIMISGLGFLLLRWPQNISKTFSQHAAAQKQSIIYYAVLFSVILPILAIFIAKWLIPTFHLSWTFTFFIWLAILTQWIVVLIPETKGWRHSTHRFLAFWGAFFLLPVLFILMRSNMASEFSRIVCGVCLLIMAAIFAVLVINKAKHPYFLILQATFFGLFFLALLSVTYL